MRQNILAAALAGLQLLWLAAPSAAAFKPVEAQVTFLKGKAEVLKTGTVVWAPAALKMRLGSGDRVSCQDSSEVEIKLDDGSFLKLRDRSLVEIERMEKQKKPFTAVTSIKAFSGKLLGCIRKLASKESKFSISTPTAVAGVRGTVFAVFVDGDSTELDVLNGQVSVAGERGREVLVGEKQMTVVAKGDSARSPAPMGAAKIAFIMMWGGAAIKLGSMGAAAASAWYASTPALVGGAAAVAVGTTAAIIIANQKKDEPGPAPATRIPNPPGWPQK